MLTCFTTGGYLASKRGFCGRTADWDRGATVESPTGICWALLRTVGWVLVTGGWEGSSGGATWMSVPTVGSWCWIGTSKEIVLNWFLTKATDSIVRCTKLAIWKANNSSRTSQVFKINIYFPIFIEILMVEERYIPFGWLSSFVRNPAEGSRGAATKGVDCLGRVAGANAESSGGQGSKGRQGFS